MHQERILFWVRLYIKNKRIPYPYFSIRKGRVLVKHENGD